MNFLSKPLSSDRAYAAPNFSSGSPRWSAAAGIAQRTNRPLRRRKRHAQLYQAAVKHSKNG